MTKQLATVEGMSCAACANTVQTKFSSLENVQDVDVDLDSKSATLNTSGPISLEILSHTLEDTPYEVTGVNKA